MDACAAGVIDGAVVLVISNHSDAPVLERAARMGAVTQHLSSWTHGEALDGAIREALAAAGVELVVLAGYVKKVGPQTLEAFRERIINVHPGPLPKYGGRGLYGEAVHRAVLAAGEAVSGATVHMVDADYDHGRVIATREVPVLPDDDAASLAARVLACEHELLPETIARIARGELALE